MVFCPGCGSDKVNVGGDKGEYPHPTAQGLVERLLMILCEECDWSWNIAGAKQVEGR